jgi:small subunit ribosomal protein S8
MSVDTIGDFLTIIRNGIMRSKRSVAAPYSNVRYNLAKLLEQEGFITGVEVAEEEHMKTITVVLKYYQGESVIHEITRVSKPSRRVYVKSKNIKAVIGGLGVSILSTNKGLITNRASRDANVGGEFICTVW